MSFKNINHIDENVLESLYRAMEDEDAKTFISIAECLPDDRTRQLYFHCPRKGSHLNFENHLDEFPSSDGFKILEYIFQHIVEGPQEIHPAIDFIGNRPRPMMRAQYH